MDLFKNRNKNLDIPHLSTAKYVQFALSIQYFSYIVDYVCSILQQNHLHIHISQFFTRITHPTSHNSLLASLISQFTTLYSYHASHISQFFTCITHLTTVYTHHVSESTDTSAPIIMAKSPILNTIFRKASHGTLKLT